MHDNKIAIVTGASKGIGKATALLLAKNNYHVTLVGRDVRDLEETSALMSKESKMESLICRGDLSSEIFLEEIVQQTVQKWGRIDVLVNNAAWRSIETMRTISLETWEKTIRTCLTAPAFLARYCAEVMEKSGGGGAIINVSSIMSARAGGNSPAYIACKGALDSLTYELAITYGRKNIRVIGINPGHIGTNMSADYVDDSGDNISDRMINYMVDATPLGRGGTTYEVAEAIYWLCSCKASFITGTTITIDGGFMHNLNDYAIKKLQFPKEF